MGFVSRLACIVCALAVASSLFGGVVHGIVTPCTQYNGQSSTASGNCIECTSILIPKSDPEQSDYVMVQDRNGEFFPILRPVAPAESKKKGNGQACMWCPETQMCGHPDDVRVLCPAPTSALPREAERLIAGGMPVQDALEQKRFFLELST